MCNANAACDFCETRCPEYIFKFSTKYDKEYNEFELDWDKFEDEFLEWYDCGKPKSNFKDIIGRNITHFMISEWDNEDEIREENRRWNCWVNYIFNIKGRYFKMRCDEALTEMQETYYAEDSKIIEVEKKVVVKVVNEWVTK